MRIPRIYQAGEFQVGQIIALSSQASQHVGVVLRMQIGAQLIIFSGDKWEFNATIVEITKRLVKVHLTQLIQQNKESELMLHLAQGIGRGDKMELIIQKTTELGITRITPIFSKYCGVNLSADRLEKKHRQWQDIAIAACEQSGRNILPQIDAPCDFTQIGRAHV